MTQLERELEASIRYVNEKKRQQEKTMSTAIERAHDNGGALVRREDELTVDDLVAQVNKIQEVMRRVMHEGEHYGVIPGTKPRPGEKEPKKVLFKSGAEKLCLLFRLDPQYSHTEHWDGTHMTVVSTCTLFHIPTGQRRGSGMGMCTTRESKYAWRKAARVCPECDAETIIKGKAEWGGGWLCFKKKGGCGVKFADGDQRIESQAESGRAPNEDLADTYNTVLKMANKRSLVAAVLNTTAASDIFTQDLEDMPQKEKPPHISPYNEDDYNPGASDPPRLMEQIKEAEKLMMQGEYGAARAQLGSRAKIIQGSVAVEIQKEKEAGNIGMAYHKELSREWSRVERQLAKREALPPVDVVASFIDDDEERKAIQEEP